MAKSSNIKLKELAVYISSVCEKDPHFGSTKLNKLIAFSDMIHFSKTRTSITGESYMKQPQGFVPRRMKPVYSELSNEKSLVRREVQRGRHVAKVPTALRQADLSKFTAEEINTVNYVISQLKNHNNTDTSELSHRLTPNWDLIEDGAEIPLSTLLFPPEYEASDDEKAYLRSLIEGKRDPKCDRLKRLSPLLRLKKK